MKNSTQSKEKQDVFYSAINERKREVGKNLTFFMLVGLTNVVATFVTLPKLGYISLYFLLLAFIAFFISAFQIVLLVKISNETERAVWTFKSKSQTYHTDYQAGFTERILSLRFLKTVTLTAVSPTLCIVEVKSTLNNKLVEKYNFNFYMELGQIPNFYECLTRHGIATSQIHSDIQADPSPPPII